MEARLRAAIQVSPGTASLHASLGELLRSQARIDEARDAFIAAVQIEPMDPRYRLDLGRAYLDLDEFVEAEVNFQWGSEIDPGDPRMFAGLGDALLGQDRPEEAVLVLERAAALDPADRDIEALLASARTASRSDDAADVGGLSFPTMLVSAMTTFFALALSIAGLGLVLPVGAAVVVLLLFVPLAILQRRRG